MQILDDSRRFWRRSKWRGMLLLITCALIIALAAVNTVVLRSSLWFTPPGVDDAKHFMTLGQYSPEGRFGPVSKHDLVKLKNLNPEAEYAIYGASDADIRWASKKWPRRDVALVSNNFFGLMGVDIALGTALNDANRGVVLSYKFWRDQLHADPEAVGKSITVGALELPVVGIAAANFDGLGDTQPSAWLPDNYTAAFFDLVLPLPDSTVNSVKEEFAQEVPFFYGLLQRNTSTQSSSDLTKWTVRDTASISLKTPNGPLVLGFDARGHTPAILPRVDLNPDKTSIVSKYLAVLAVLNAALAFLAILNLTSFWTARTSERGQELQTLIAVGAKREDLLRLFLSEAIPFLVLILALSVPLALTQLHLLKTTEPFSTYLASRGVHLVWKDFLPGVMLLIGIGLLAVALPWFYLSGNVLRSRSLGVTSTTKRARIVSMWLQWTFSTIVAAAVGTSFLIGHRLSNASWGGSLDPLLLSVHGIDGDSKNRLFSLLNLDRAGQAAIDTPPLTPLQVRGDSYLAEGGKTTRRHSIYFNQATPNAFEALGLSVLHGVLFQPNSESEILVSEAAAKYFDSDMASLVGKHIVRIDSLNVADDRTYKIVGIVANTRYNDVRSPPEAVVYTAFSDSNSSGTLILPRQQRYKIQLARRSLTPETDQQTIRVLDEAKRVSEVLAEQIRTELLLAIFTFAYAAIALSMMCLGLLAQARTQLTHQGRELALRVALGASLGRTAREFVRTPTIVAASAVIPALMLMVIAIQQRLINLPMVQENDWLLLTLIVTVTIAVFCVALLMFVRRWLSRYNLSELLRIER